jgi:hypothetical protein
MNTSYKLVYSEALNAWVAVSEHVNARGKKGTVRLLAAVSLLAAGSLGAGASWAAPPLATQLPVGAQVAAGTVHISQTQTATAARMAIAQGSNQAIVSGRSSTASATLQVAGSSSSVSFNTITSPTQQTSGLVSVLVPAWIRYDAQTKTLVADAMPASAFPLAIVVTVGGQSTLIQDSESQVNL